jgi:hypothetical protein
MAGVDFEKILVETDEDRRTITVTMPSSEIQAVTIDKDTFKIYSEKDSLWNPLKLEDYNISLDEFETAAKEKALASGILTRSDEQAQISCVGSSRACPGCRDTLWSFSEIIVEDKTVNMKKIMIIALLILAAVVSATVVAPMAADPANHRHSIEQTDDKIASVMALSGGAAATSATLSLLPGDICTPLSEQLAEMAKYFLLILSALYLEKFLISLSGYISFMALIPLALVILIIAIAARKKNLYSTAAKVAIMAVIIFCIVPASVRLSDMVYQTQAAKVNETIEEYNNLEIGGDADGGFINEITSLTSNTIDEITDFIDNLMESLAVMIVTACLIPLLVFVFLVWLLKVIFASNTVVFDKL